ncbi:hypothetical protein KS554_002330 [Salmonella enterica]|nr:hypothetical protein [Salmonella enterica]EHQ9697902.1 hypothetical protein [Salmonella enterica]EJU4173281.1 hypothetical protein [Salmonella enterica]ELS5010259.1 hypothetical protein [Salmonella enterica]
MNEPDTTAWSKTVCTATGGFFTRWTPCSCGREAPCFSCNTYHLNIAFSYIFPDTGLALGQTCQSGLWRSFGPEDGNYAYLGAFKGVFSGNNTTGKPFKLYVWGGNPPPRKINFGNADNCANTFSLTASVGGQTVAHSIDGNSEWGKSGSFSFDVPNGASFSITSNGMMAYGCDYGTFSVFRYQ